MDNKILITSLYIIIFLLIGCYFKYFRYVVIIIIYAIILTAILSAMVVLITISVEGGLTYLRTIIPYQQWYIFETIAIISILSLLFYMIMGNVVKQLYIQYKNKRKK